MASDSVESVKEYVKKEFGLDDDQFTELMREVSSVLSESMKELEIATAKGDYPAARSAAHYIKGSLSNMGVDKATNIALNAEHAALKKDQARLEKAFHILHEELSKLVDLSGKR